MKTFEGIVVSDKMTKSAVIMLERQARHPLYGKIISRKRKIHAQNEIGAKVGQMVKIVETRPISKTITFKITEILPVKGKNKKTALAEALPEVKVAAKPKKTDKKVEVSKE